MEGKSLSKKAIVAIVIIAILVVAAISMVVVFLKDQGETEATAIGENNSNSEQTQDAVPENNENNNQGTATQSEEPQQEEQSEEQTTVANNDGATTNSGTTATTPVQQTTTTTDGSTQVATTTTTETIPTQALTLAWSNMTVYGGELLANLDADVTDVTAPVRLATNILKDGESNDLREYYVKRGDTIYMYIAVNEELAHNPTFTLINNGKEYVMEDSQVIVKQNPAKAWDYTVIYEIPEDTTFVDGEIELKVSNIEDKAGNKREDENGPTNGHKVYFDTTAPEKLNLGIARNTSSEDTRDQRYAKAGDSIRVLVSFPEKLAVEPKVEMFGKEYDVTYRPDSSIEESNIYYYMADVKIDQNTPEGEVAFKVYGYKDVAGNEGTPLTNADINDGKYTNVIIDNTKPTIEPTEDSISGSEGNYSRIGFKVTDDNGVASYEINGETLILTNGEISYEALKSYLKEGVNTVVASDEAGNTAEYTFNYDAVAPTREYSNIMVNGDDSTKHEFYAKIGDKLWVSIGVKEELAHNPSFTLINNLSLIHI